MANRGSMRLLGALCLLVAAAGGGSPEQKHCTRGWAAMPQATVGLSSENTDGQQQRKLRVENTCSEEVDVFWLDEQGEEVHLKSLKPGRKFNMATASGHAFRAYFAAGYGTRSDLPSSALPRATPRQLALEHVVLLVDEAAVESLDIVRIAPCGLDAVPYHHQRVAAKPASSDAGGSEASAAEAAAQQKADEQERQRERQELALSAAKAVEDDTRRQELEAALQQREVEAATKEAEATVREQELRDTLAAAQAQAKEQEEHAREATAAATAAAADAEAKAAAAAAEAKAAAAAAAAAAAERPAATAAAGEEDLQWIAVSGESTSKPHHSLISKAISDRMLVVAVAVVCILCGIAFWLHTQLRESAQANADLLQQVEAAKARTALRHKESAA